MKGFCRQARIWRGVKNAVTEPEAALFGE